MEILGCRKDWIQKEQLEKLLPTRKNLEISMGNSIYLWSGSRAYTCKASLVRVNRQGLNGDIIRRNILAVKPQFKMY